MKKNDPMPKQQNKKEAKRVHNLIIVDESGSMYVIRKQAFVGMNETLQTVRACNSPHLRQRAHHLALRQCPSLAHQEPRLESLQPRGWHTPLRCHR